MCPLARDTARRSSGCSTCRMMRCDFDEDVRHRCRIHPPHPTTHSQPLHIFQSSQNIATSGNIVGNRNIEQPYYWERDIVIMFGISQGKKSHRSTLEGRANSLSPNRVRTMAAIREPGLDRVLVGGLRGRKVHCNAVPTDRILLIAPPSRRSASTVPVGGNQQEL